MVSLQKPDLFEPEVRPSSAQQPLNVRETRAHTTSIKLSNNKQWLFSIEKAVSDYLWTFNINIIQL